MRTWSLATDVRQLQDVLILLQQVVSKYTKTLSTYLPGRIVVSVVAAVEQVCAQYRAALNESSSGMCACVLHSRTGRAVGGVAIDDMQMERCTIRRSFVAVVTAMLSSGGDSFALLQSAGCRERVMDVMVDIATDMYDVTGAKAGCACLNRLLERACKLRDMKPSVDMHLNDEQRQQDLLVCMM
jgi:hypothetical protein